MLFLEWCCRVVLVYQLSVRLEVVYRRAECKSRSCHDGLEKLSRSGGGLTPRITPDPLLLLRADQEREGEKEGGRGRDREREMVVEEERRIDWWGGGGHRAKVSMVVLPVDRGIVGVGRE